MKRLVKIICLILSMLIMISAFGCSCNGDQEEQTTIVEKGFIVKNEQSTYTIVTPEEPTECEEYAAEELQSFIAQSTGVWLPIKTENLVAYTKDSTIISLGQTEILKSLNLGLDFNSLKEHLANTANEKDDIKASRILERINSLMDFVELKDENYRRS